MQPFPKDVVRKLKYTAMGTYTMGATAGTYVFRLNGLYDPDFTSTGHLPYGFDLLLGAPAGGLASAPYQRYTVISCDYKVTNTTGGYCNFAVTVSNASGATGATTLDRIMGQPGSVWKVGTLYSEPVTFTGHLDMAELFGVTRQKLMTDDVFSGTYNSNPSNTMFLCISAQDVDLYTASAGHWQVELVFEARFWEPNSLTVF